MFSTDDASPRVCCTCYVCGEAIREDDLYMHFDGIDICQQCVDDLTIIARYKEVDRYD